MSSSARWIVGAVISLACVFASAQARDVYSDRYTQIVTVSADELSTDAGRQAIYRRLRSAAKRVCLEVDGRRTLDNAVSYRRCFEDTMSMAVAQVRNPFFKEYVARANGPRKAMFAAAK